MIAGRAAVELEIAYAQDVLPRGILGLNADLFRDYVQFIADRRLERIGLPLQYGRPQLLPLDERDHRPSQGKELLRDPRDGVPKRREAELGLMLHAKVGARRRRISCSRQRPRYLAEILRSSG